MSVDKAVRSNEFYKHELSFYSFEVEYIYLQTVTPYKILLFLINIQNTFTKMCIHKNSSHFSTHHWWCALRGYMLTCWIPSDKRQQKWHITYMGFCQTSNNLTASQAFKVLYQINAKESWKWPSLQLTLRTTDQVNYQREYDICDLYRKQATIKCNF
jgi:hypothetical protein